MPDIGGAYKCAVPQTKQTTLGSLKSIPEGSRCRLATVLAPGSAAKVPNTDSVFVGPSQSAEFELIPGAAVDITDTDPALIAFQSPSAGQLVFIIIGGSPVVWVEQPTIPARVAKR